MLPHEKPYSDSCLYAKHVVCCARNFGITTHIRTKVKDVYIGELFRYRLTKTVILARIKVPTIGDERDYSIIC